MWVGCSTLYWAMFVPAFLNSAPAAGAAAAPALAAFSQVCHGFERPAIHLCGPPNSLSAAAGRLLGMQLNCWAARAAAAGWPSQPAAVHSVCSTVRGCTPDDWFAGAGGCGRLPAAEGQGAAGAGQGPRTVGGNEERRRMPVPHMPPTPISLHCPPFVSWCRLGMTLCGAQPPSR